MIDKITSFFSPQKKNPIIPLYLTEDKEELISIELTPEKTLYQIYLENINQISVIQAKIFQKKPIPKNYYSFTLYSSQDPFIKIKLDYSSKPWHKLILKNMLLNYSLFYTPNDNYFANNQSSRIHRRLNNLTKNKSQDESNSDKHFTDETHIINFVSPSNKIIDGEIEKFSYSQSVFIKIFIYIDSNKIMYQEVLKKPENNEKGNNHSNSFNLQNLWNVIPLSNISCICMNSFEGIDLTYIKMNKFKERLFMIKTFNKENIIFKARDKYERDNWFNELRNIFEQVRVDKIFFKYNKEIKEISKEIYLNQVKFVWKLIGIKGIICYKTSRKFFFESFNDGVLEKIVECCVEYKRNVIRKNKEKALEQIQTLGGLIGIGIIKENKNFMEEEDEINELNNLLDEETYLKIVNLLKIQKINKKNSLIIFEHNLLDNLLKKIQDKFLIKEHKKIIQRKKEAFLKSLNIIPAAQFCKNINFNTNKMNVLFKENININIPSNKSYDSFSEKKNKKYFITNSFY